MEKGKDCSSPCLSPAFVDRSNRVSELAELIELEHQPSLDELLTAVINRDEVEEMVKRPVEAHRCTLHRYHSSAIHCRVVDSSAPVAENEQPLPFKRTGAAFAIAVPTFVCRSASGPRVPLPYPGWHM